MTTVSVVTISFNQIDHLPRCVGSVGSQLLPGDEHIVIDPGSTDGSREWLRDNASTLTRLVFEPDQGPADGLNRGLATSRGDVFFYLNSDDELPPDAIARIRALHEASNADAIVGDGWIIDADSRPVSHVRSDRFTPIRYAMGVGTVLQQGTSFKRARLEQLGVAFNPKNRLNWDTELLFDLYRKGGSVAYTRETLGYFRMYAGTISTSPTNREALRSERARLVREAGVVTPFAALRVAGLPLRTAKWARNRFGGALGKERFPGHV